MLLALVLGTLALANSGLATQYTTEPPQNECQPADVCLPGDPNSDCQPPNCWCPGTEPTVSASERPQIVYLTYDDAFTAYGEEHFYRGLFNGTYKNPDDNPIRATHFLTASFTDYSLVHEYYNMGHEMASHSITHQTPEDHWAGMNVDSWTAEAEGMRKMISQFARIPKEDIKGFRSPFLRMGGDEQYKSLVDAGFTYDCSWASREFGYQHLDQGLFPYTMDYRSIQDCEVGPCPECSYPGFWVQPMLDLEDNWFNSNPLHPDWGQPCSMLDGCVFIDPESDENDALEMLLRNFNKVYNGNRAPFGLYMHAAWFYGEVTWHYKGYKMFLEEILKNDDVWIVPIIDGLNVYANYSDKTNQELLAMGTDNPLNPTNVIAGRTTDCSAKDPCKYKVTGIPEIPDGEERYMTICGRTSQGFPQNCPSEYPWLGNPCGGNLPCA